VRIGVVLLAGAMLTVLVGSCAHGDTGYSIHRAAPPATVKAGKCGQGPGTIAANVTVWFVGELQEARDSTIQGGVADPYGCAYGRLCRDVRARVSEAEFRRTSGEAVSRVLSAYTWTGTRDPQNSYNPGPTFPDGPTDDTHTWVDGLFGWLDPFSVPVGTPGRSPVPRPDEPWRTYLVREDGEWHICSFEKQ
jgi:hypothetical protein